MTTTQADFYAGRGEAAVYLGTSSYLVEAIHPVVFQSLTETEFTAVDFGRVVRAMVTSKEWPHAYADSTETPWTYAYDTGSVYVYRYGVEMLVIRCNTHRTVRGGVSRESQRLEVVRDWRPVNSFPTMKETKSA